MTSFEGAAEFRRNLARIASGVPDEAARALVPEAEGLGRKARALVPVDTGALRDSIEVTRPMERGGVVSVEVRAGGPSAPYAAKVHEDVEAHHERGQAKFLQRPTLELRGGLLRAIGRRFRLGKLAR